jgi:hypothetical protein
MRVLPHEGPGGCGWLEDRPLHRPRLASATSDMTSTQRAIEANILSLVREHHEIAGEERWIYTLDPDDSVNEFIDWQR